MTSAASLSNPILNSPYDVPARHWEMGPHGPTGSVLEGRRPSQSFVPVAPVRKGRKRSASASASTEPQADDTSQLELSLTHEQVQRNSLINELRQAVGDWRRAGYPGTTTTTLKLLRHWADETRDNRVLFAQREAAETAVFLAEVSGRRGWAGVGQRDWRGLLAAYNEEHNAGLPRVALKTATGSGKTVVMAMLIAWQTLNKVAAPSDRRFVKRFLIIAPGITIRDRLRVLQPQDPGNYYDERDVVPAGAASELLVTGLVRCEQLRSDLRCGRSREPTWRPRPGYARRACASGWPGGS